ncbi:paraflagellar rod protein, putative [Bodo saltans]|nr:paraflagellar rod protein, putative [Bodo saltans]|eukprot:CUG06054.1 paraflagellar rod protein, putative [Bodo saltans]
MLVYQFGPQWITDNSSYSFFCLRVMASQVHHARAQAALRSLDAAKAQREANANLRNEFLDAEDNLLHMHQQFFSHKLHYQMKNIKESATRRLHEFEDQLSFSETCKRQPYERYMEDCRLVVPMCDLASASEHGDTHQYDQNRTTDLVRQTIDEFLLLPHAQGALDSTQSKSTVERMRLLTARCEKVVDAATVTSSPFLLFANQVINVSRTALQIPPIDDPLKKLVDKLTSLDSSNRSLEAHQQEAADDGNIAANEGYMSERVTIMEAMADVITHKFHLLEEEERTSLNTTQAAIDSAALSVAEGIRERKQNVANKQKRVQQDLSNLEAATRRAEIDEGIARGGFQSDMASSDELLERNAAESEEVWSQIHALETRLQKLANERRDEADRRVKAVEREERRRVDMRHFSEFAAAHHDKLFSVSRLLEADELLCDMMDEALRGFAVIGLEKIAFDRGQVAAARSAALQEHHMHFREQYLHLGELLYKKERALEELTQRSVYARAQQELAMDSFNPKAKEYAIQKSDIDVDIRKMDEEIAVLQSKASLYVQAFKPTERALRAEGKVFEHPVSELQLRNKEKSRKIAAFHAYEVAQKPPTQLGGRIDTSRHTVTEERAQVEDARANYVRARPPPPPGRALPQEPLDSCLSISPNPHLLD